MFWARRCRSPARWDSEEEARSIGEEIEQLQRDAREQGLDHPLDEIAILVRASFQMREFEDRFIQLGLPYRVIGGPRFYERAEIRDALAYLRVIAQPADDLAFERIVNVPKRGLGDATVQMLHDHARKQRIPLTQAAAALSATDEMKPKPRLALRELMANFERWRARKDAMPHTELAEIVLDESGYTAMWQNDKSADAAGRLENLKELVRSMEEFENLAGFLEHISLVMDRDSSEGEQAVNIMTLHSAKGLEFDTVFLPGWEEGLFPHQRSLDESGRAGLEEERRLAHVGLTRARKRAKIYFATNRRIHGLWTSTMPSRFLDELPEAHVAVKEPAAGGFGMSGYGASPLRRGEFLRLELFDARLAARPGAQGARAVSTRTASRVMCRMGCLTTTAMRTQITSPLAGEVAPKARVRGKPENRRWQSPLTRLPPKVGVATLATARSAEATSSRHRRRTGGQIDRRRLVVRRRRPRVSPEIRQRQRHRRGRQQADHQVRQGGRKAGGG